MPIVFVAPLRERIAQACAACGREPTELRVIAVTKTQDPPVLPALAAEGLWDWGENRPDHLARMHQAAPSGGRFHFIGRLQSRQLKLLTPLVDCVHSLSSAEHAQRLDRLCVDRERPLQVYLQVNTAGEAQKDGVQPQHLGTLVDQVRACSHLELVGLMCMAPDLSLPTVHEDVVRQAFAQTRILAHSHGLKRLSMGMSGDLHLAIAEGATELRIGSALFQASHS